jgi:hypothetical protein
MSEKSSYHLVELSAEEAFQKIGLIEWRDRIFALGKMIIYLLEDEALGTSTELPKNETLAGTPQNVDLVVSSQVIHTVGGTEYILKSDQGKLKIQEKVPVLTMRKADALYKVKKDETSGDLGAPNESASNNDPTANDT